MTLDIPSDDVGSIATICELPDSLMDMFVTALEGARPLANPKAMAGYIAPRVPSIPVERLASVLETIYTLCQIRELSDVSHDRFMTDLMEGIQRNSRLQIAAEDLPRLRTILERLLNVDAIQIIAKAARLQRDGERLYCSSKVLSDIRPVFGKDPSSRPVGAVLAHTLRIGYHEGRDHKEFHVVLDSSDLAALVETACRAQDKDSALREFLKSSQLDILDD